MVISMTNSFYRHRRGPRYHHLHAHNFLLLLIIQRHHQKSGGFLKWGYPKMNGS